MTLKELIEKEGLTLELQSVNHNPNNDGFKGFHYLATIKKGDKTFTTFFSTGYGWIETRFGRPVPHGVTYDPKHGFLENRVPEAGNNIGRSNYRIKKPTLEDILDSLALDASVLDQTFEEFCGEFGYDTDSRKAEETYQACRENAKGLLSLLGKETFKTLCFETERL